MEPIVHQPKASQIWQPENDTQQLAVGEQQTIVEHNWYTASCTQTQNICIW